MMRQQELLLPTSAFTGSDPRLRADFPSVNGLAIMQPSVFLAILKRVGFGTAIPSRLLCSEVRTVPVALMLASVPGEDREGPRIPSPLEILKLVHTGFPSTTLTLSRLVWWI